MVIFTAAAALPPDSPLPLPFGERGFLLLSATIGALLLLTIAFAVATAVLRFKNNWKAAHWERLEREWSPLLLEVLEGSRPPSTLWEHVEHWNRLYFVDFLFRYARRVRGAESEILCALAEPALGDVVSRMTGGDPERRARATETVAVLGLRDHAARVVAALDDPSPLVAMIAARNLARKEHPEYAAAVLQRLHRFEQWSPKYLASMLAAMGPAAAPPLRQTLSDSSQPPGVRAVAAAALRALHDPAAADLAASMLATETDRDLLAAALRLLAVVGRPAHLIAIRALCSSPDFVVRAQAVAVLGSLGTTDDLDRLRSAFHDDSPWVAIHAARGLRDAGETRLLSALAGSEHARSGLARQVLTEGAR